MIDQWKVDKIKHYHGQGWSVREIARKLEMESYEIYSIIYDRIHQTTSLGHKDAAYYDDEDDYVNFNSI